MIVLRVRKEQRALIDQFFTHVVANASMLIAMVKFEQRGNKRKEEAVEFIHIHSSIGVKNILAHMQISNTYQILII